MNISTLIPAGQGDPLLRRLLIVWCLALPIAGLSWSSHSPGHFDRNLVYSYAISTLIWAFTDLARFVLRRWLGSGAPHQPSEHAPAAPGIGSIT
jgi:hypothetical protein